MVPGPGRSTEHVPSVSASVHLRIVPVFLFLHALESHLHGVIVQALSI